jgi:hypothetical protein
MAQEWPIELTEPQPQLDASIGEETCPHPNAPRAASFSTRAAKPNISGSAQSLNARGNGADRQSAARGRQTLTPLQR